MTDFERRVGEEVEAVGAGFDFLVEPLPERADEAWCILMTMKYGDGNLRTCIGADECLLEVLDADGVPTPGSYREAFFVASEGTPVINGVMRGAKLFPDWKNDQKGLQYLPHAILTDVSITHSTTESISRHPEQKILVPLTNSFDRFMRFYTNIT